MMLIKLLKIFFKENFSLKRIFGFDFKKSKIKATLIVLAIIYGIGSMFLVFGFMFFDFGKLLNELGQSQVLLEYIFIYATVLSMVFVLLRANGYLFHYKDFQILQPLPIKQRQIILAKLCLMMITIYMSLFVIILPIGFSYFFHSGLDIVSLLNFIISLLFIPILPVVVFSFLSFLLANFSSRFRFSKIINVILMFVVFFGIMYFSMTLNFEASNPLLGQMALFEKITKVIPSANWFISAIHNNNFLALLGLVAFNLAILVLFVFLLEKFSIKTNQIAQSVKVKTSNKAVISKKRSILTNILLKELRKFFNVTIYVFNSGFGPIFLALSSVLIIVFKSNIDGFMVNFEEVNIQFELLLLVFVAFIISTVFTSAISLSLEGKNFWIIKSLPIKASTVMFGKMLFNILLVLPIAIFFLFIAGIIFQIGIVKSILMILFVTSFSFVTSSLGSIINLYFPKFDFINETEVVKQSIGAFLGMFGAWLLITINGLIYYFLQPLVSFEIIVLLNSLINYLFFGICIIFISRNAQTIFNKL